MRTSNKVALSLLAVIGTILIVRHGHMAIQPALPKDMPADAHFVRSGYDIQHLEAKCDWVACGTDSEQNTDFCRVTDAHGQVVYQGDFLPLRSNQPLPASELKVSAQNPDNMWVQGPAEAGPVPVIRLTNGVVLVPADDSEALADRWSHNPDELRQIEE